MGLKLYFHVFLTRVNSTGFIKGIVMHKILRCYQSPRRLRWRAMRGEAKATHEKKGLWCVFNPLLNDAVPRCKTDFLGTCRCWIFNMCLEKRKSIYWGKMEMLDFIIKTLLWASILILVDLQRQFMDEHVEWHVAMATEVEVAFIYE